MCTDFLVVASDSSAVNGRSMEFGPDLNSQLQVHAPGEKHHSRASLVNPHGLSWTAKYGYVGLTAELYGIRVISDGMNTQGLSAGALWMPGSQFPKSAKEHAKALMPEQFVEWALGNFATVDEVYRALNEREVELWHSDWLSKIAPLHFAIHDAQRNSMVVEFIDGDMQLYKGERNPVAVLTNHPTFPEQLENLKNYARLSPYDAEPVVLGTGSFKPHGCGSGLVGLPGDSTPPSRFVRTTYLKEYARPAANATEACALAFHLLNAVDIPRGTSRSLKAKPDTFDAKVRNPHQAPHNEADDYTQWVVVKDLTNTILNVRFYDSMSVQSVNLKTLDFHAAAGKTFPVPPTPMAIDITAKLTS